MIRERRGQSMVEFALILPVFVLILVGIFDFGRAVFAYSTINNAAREGARLAIVDQTVSHIQARAASEAVSLGIDATDVSVDFRSLEAPDTAGSCPAVVAGDDDAQPGIDQCLAVVRVPYVYQAATPLVGNIVGTIQLAGESRFKVGFDCEGPECPLGE